MYYIIGSEDILHRSATLATVDPEAEDPRAHQWHQWLSSQGNDDLSKEARGLFS